MGGLVRGQEWQPGHRTDEEGREGGREGGRKLTCPIWVSIATTSGCTVWWASRRASLFLTPSKWFTTPQPYSWGREEREGGREGEREGRRVENG